MKKVLVPLADGFEEIEAVTVADVLRRAGIETVLAGLPSSIIEGSNGLKVIADKKMDNVRLDDFAALVLPGGNRGCENLGNSKTVMQAIEHFEEKGKLVAAICAAPSLLAKAGILKDRRATIHPGREKEIPRPRDARVIEDNNVITSMGPGTAIEFALKIVENLEGKQRAEKIRRELCI